MAKFVYWVLLFGSTALIDSVSSKSPKLPSTFQRCTLSDPLLNQCLKNAVQNVIPEMVKGVPSLGVYSIDPLDILKADVGNTEGPVALNLNFKNLKIGGLRSAQITDLKYDAKNYRMLMRTKVAYPLILQGDYSIYGRVLVLPIQGQGQCELQLDHLNADLDIVGKEIERAGNKFMEVERLDLSFNTTRLHLHFDNLFNGNKQLGDNMNRFLNENWKEILRELKPSIDQTFGAAFQAIANRIFLKVPYSQIFLS